MDWLPYILLLVCGVVFVVLGAWYRTHKKKEYLREVGQILGFSVIEWDEGCCSDCRDSDPNPYPLRGNTFCYCDGGGGGCGDCKGGNGKGGDGAIVCVILIVFGVLVSIAACLAFCPTEPHFQVEDPRRKGRFHIIYNTRYAYVYHEQRFETLEQLRDQLRHDFSSNDRDLYDEEGEEEQEGETAVVPMIRGEEREIEMEEGCVHHQQMTV